MRQKVFEGEMKIAEIQGKIRQTRGINWVIISFSIIILTMIIGLLVTTFLWSNISNKLNENTNTPGTSTTPK